MGGYIRVSKGCKLARFLWTQSMSDWDASDCVWQSIPTFPEILVQAFCLCETARVWLGLLLVPYLRVNTRTILKQWEEGQLVTRYPEMLENRLSVIKKKKVKKQGASLDREWDGEPEHAVLLSSLKSWAFALFKGVIYLFICLLEGRYFCHCMIPPIWRVPARSQQNAEIPFTASPSLLVLPLS